MFNYKSKEGRLTAQYSHITKIIEQANANYEEKVVVKFATVESLNLHIICLATIPCSYLSSPRLIVNNIGLIVLIISLNYPSNWRTHPENIVNLIKPEHLHFIQATTMSEK